MSFLLRTTAALRSAASAFLLLLLEFFSVPWRRVAITVVLLCLAVLLNPPLRSVLPGEIGVRVNRLTGAMAVLPEGPVFAVPFVHALYLYSLRDQVYRPVRSARAGGEAPFQSVEGLSIGMELTVRYALAEGRIASVARRLPRDVGKDLIEPVVDGVLYRTLSRFTVKEIFSEKRAELQRIVESELRDELAKDGVAVRSVFLGNVDLPPQYRQGMEGLLAEELLTQKKKYTFELKEQEFKETELAAEAHKVESQKQAEAQAQAQVIAAKGQAEAMRHVLPFKRKEIQQRRLEAEARKQTRVKDAEADAEARKIESGAEADARRRLADADAYRLDVTGKAHSDQLARESRLIAENPLLIQKALADKLSDKIQVIVASPDSAGAFLTGGLVGVQQRPQLAKAGGQ
jgi:regulator of protease activity HflC (stomatin/prohibitin superfamily)